MLAPLNMGDHRAAQPSQFAQPCLGESFFVTQPAQAQCNGLKERFGGHGRSLARPIPNSN